MFCLQLPKKQKYQSAADPGFPVGGGTALRCGRFSAETCAKRKELGPVGGRTPAAPPGSATVSGALRSSVRDQPIKGDDRPSYLAI